MTPSLLDMFMDVFQGANVSPKDRKKRVESEVRKEHPTWPRSKVGSEATWRIRHAEKNK